MSSIKIRSVHMFTSGFITLSVSYDRCKSPQVWKRKAFNHNSGNIDWMHRIAEISWVVWRPCISAPVSNCPKKVLVGVQSMDLQKHSLRMDYQFLRKSAASVGSCYGNFQVMVSFLYIFVETAKLIVYCTNV